MFEDTIPAPTPGFMPISTAAKRLAVTEGRVRN